MKRTIYALFTLIVTTFTATAQTTGKEYSKEKFSTQLKNGTVPGLVFAPQTTALQVKAAKADKKPLNDTRAMKNNTGPNIKTMAGSNAPVKPAAKKGPTLASDQPAAPVKDSVITARPPMQEAPKQ